MQFNYWDWLVSFVFKLNCLLTSNLINVPRFYFLLKVNWIGRKDHYWNRNDGIDWSVCKCVDNNDDDYYNKVEKIKRRQKIVKNESDRSVCIDLWKEMNQLDLWASKFIYFVFAWFYSPIFLDDSKDAKPWEFNISEYIRIMIDLSRKKNILNWDTHTHTHQHNRFKSKLFIQFERIKEEG